MRTFKRTYYISHVCMESTESKSIAYFQINGLTYTVCIRGYTEEQRQEIESGIDTLYWDDDEFNKFLFDFIEIFRTVMQKAEFIDAMDTDAGNIIFLQTVFHLSNLNEKLEIVEYKKRIRTAYKLISAK